MKLEYRAYTLTTNAEWTRVHGTRSCKTTTIEIPFLVNSIRAIKSGEELLVFKEQPSTKRPAVDQLGDAGKRAKVDLWERLCTDAGAGTR